MCTPSVHLCRCLCVQVHLLADAAAVYITKNSVRNDMAPQQLQHAPVRLSQQCAIVRDSCVPRFFLSCRYRHTSYHKQTKNQWARDDPAFVVVLCMLVAVAATAYCIT